MHFINGVEMVNCELLSFKLLGYSQERKFCLGTLKY